jgi:hypothetical protein
MNIKAIVTAALVIGSSSLALASPERAEYPAQGGVQVGATVQVRDHRTDERPDPRPIYVSNPAPAPIVVSRPLPGRDPFLRTLADDTKINRSGMDFIRFARPMKLRTIKLQGQTGRTSVSTIAIKFANGRQQIINENKLLTKDGCIDIDLNGNVRNVTGIVIYGSGGMRSSFDVLGA